MSDVKVVINACYGGFSLSTEAVREYLRRTGREWTERELGAMGLTVFDVTGDDNWYERDIDRTDPTLIAIVEEWGSRADGQCASLKIETVPKGTHYIIDEYDGYEAIQTRGGIGWNVA